MTTTKLEQCHYIITAPELDELLRAEIALQDGKCKGVDLTFDVRMDDGTERQITITCNHVDLPPELSRAYEMEAVVDGKFNGKPVGCSFRVGGEGGFESPL